MQQWKKQKIFLEIKNKNNIKVDTHHFMATSKGLCVIFQDEQLLEPESAGQREKWRKAWPRLGVVLRILWVK